jgi:hypothetical protein
MRRGPDSVRPPAKRNAARVKAPRERDYLLPILKIFVPQSGHVPCVAGRPFFMVMSLASLISFLALHLTQ